MFGQSRVSSSMYKRMTSRDNMNIDDVEADQDDDLGISFHSISYCIMFTTGAG